MPTHLHSFPEKLIKTTSKYSFSLVTSIFAASLVALGSAATVATAQAADDNAALTEVVKFGDLNLGSAAGANVLYSRIRGAANSVCAPLEARDLGQKRRWQTCYDQAIASAVTHIDSVRVTAIYLKITDSKHAG